MKKLLIAMGIGFILGSRAGRGPYRQLEGQVRKITGRPEVQEKLDQAKTAASEQFDDVAGKAKDKLPGSHNGSEPQPKQGTDIGLALGSE